MHTFLVPTDFSETAQKAADYAASLAKLIGGSLEILHVYMLPTTVSEIPYLMETADMLQPEFESRAAREAERITTTFDIPCKWQVQIGVPSAEIHFQAEELNAYMIVMGMHGDANKTAFLGSTTIATMKKCTTPILIIPEQAQFQPLSSVLLATDFNAAIPNSVFDPLLPLLNYYSSHLHILHVNKEAADQDVIGAPPVKDLHQPEDAISGKMRFVEIFKPYAHEYHEVTDDTITNGILHFEEQNPVDLLVMIAQQHGFFQTLFGNSQTRKMAHKTSLPLLVLSGKG